VEFSRIEEEDRRSAEKEAEAKRAAGRSLRGSLVGVSQLAGVLHLHKILPQQLQNGPGRHEILGWGPV
jgi:hypothetical protein